MTYAIAIEDKVLAPEKVLLAVDRILMSRVFVHSTRLSRFLRFAVDHALQGKAGELKEYTIATQVYDRTDDFDPALDTIVRSEARRLRKKLKEYYDTEGKRDAVVIGLRPGSYIPVPRVRTASPEVADLPGNAVSIAVEPFECDLANALAWECAFGISDEILHRLTSVVGIHVICGSAHGSSPDGHIPEEMALLPRARVVIRGTVRADDNLLRVTTRATTADRRLLWSHQVDSLVGGTRLIPLQERVATEVMAHIGPWLSGLQGPETTSKTEPLSWFDSHERPAIIDAFNSTPFDEDAVCGPTHSVAMLERCCEESATR